jgi:hypothetical protein
VRSDGPMIGRLVVDIASARGERVGGAYGRDDIVNCLAGCGGVRFVVQKRCVGGVDAAVEAVDRQCGQVAIYRRCFLTAVRTMSGLPSRLVSDEACSIDADPSIDSSMRLPRWRAGRGIGARLVP